MPALLMLRLLVVGQEMAGEPVGRETGHFFQRAGFLEQVRGAGNDFQPFELRASRLSARSFIAITGSSRPPTISNVGAMTWGRASPARSGRPPRDTTALTRSGRSAAATRAAPPPVLAPK